MLWTHFGVLRLTVRCSTFAPLHPLTLDNATDTDCFLWVREHLRGTGLSFPLEEERHVWGTAITQQGTDLPP